MSPAPPLWVRTADELGGLARALRTAGRIALDSESDSLHHYREKVCLIQVAAEDGPVHLIDPLAVSDLSPLKEIMESAQIEKVFHGADYDLATLGRDFGFHWAGIFDTMLAAKFLGLPAVGLGDLVEAEFGVRLPKGRQKDDWSWRPLAPEQERYAADDVAHLLDLRDRLVERLRAVGRLEWVREECDALAREREPARTDRVTDFLRVKGARDLDPRGLAILRALVAAREEWARKADRPVFKIAGELTLVHLTMRRPRTFQALRNVPGCSPYIVNRYGEGILGAIREGERAPAVRRPVPPRSQRPPAGTARRAERLAGWRAGACERVRLEPGLLLPKWLISRLAVHAPSDRAGLEQVEGVRRWRIENFGDEILAVLKPPRGERE